MNILKLTFLLFICPCFVQAQIMNSGFETPQDTVLSLPGNWKVKNVDGFTSCLDNEIKYSGQQSLNIKSTQEVNSNYISFSQTANFDVNSLKRISISAYMKSKDVKGNAGL